MATEYKLKGLTSIDLKNGQKKEVEVDGIEGGKVLLAKVGDKVHAMSPNCTHYGAPLVKGVLTGDGRITCPWHGGITFLSLTFSSIPFPLPSVSIHENPCLSIPIQAHS